MLWLGRYTLWHMATLACFTPTELPRPGLLGRVFKRRPKEHCYIEIQNLLAKRPLAELAAADVENLLSDYQVPRPDASPRLMSLYQTALNHFSQDGELSPVERGALQQLRYVLGLDDAEAEQAQLDALRERYRERLQHALTDSHLSANERADLEATGKSFGLNEEVLAAIYKEEVLRVVQQVFDSATADRRLTEEEDQRLADIAANLGVTLTHSDETKRAIERFPLLARIENGQIPEIPAPILLQRSEQCFAQFPSRLHEKRSVTKRVGYSGPSGSIRIMKGLRWRYGYVNVHRVTTEELRQIDTGTLYVTNKRLLFNGQSKNVSVPLKKVIQFTLYRDGVQIEKDTGRDQYFLGEGDLELLGAVLESALRNFRDSA